MVDKKQESADTRVCCFCKSTNLQNARDNLKRNAEDMELIKDFSTTTEVMNLPLVSCPRSP